MSHAVISVDRLGKMYRIGADRGSGGLRHALDGRLRDLGRRLSGRGASAEKYEDFWALRDVSFEVARGECVGIIGRNGAGKSTLLKILSRITEPSEGEIRMRGRVGSLLEVGTGFHPELTGRENIFLNGAVLGMGRHETARKFDEIVSFSEVERFLDTPVKYYSSGMYMRLAFSVAAHLEPEILIVDEVLAVGDAEFQKKSLGKMGEVAKGGRTVIFVSHDVSAIQTLCQRCITLSGGRVIANGSPAVIVAQYLNTNAATASFLRDSEFVAPVFVRESSVIISADDHHTWMDIETIVEAKSEATISLDIRLADHAGRPVGFAPIGSFDQRRTISLKAGDARIRSRHDISMLAVGKYTVSIDVADPPYAYLDRVDRCLQFEVNTPPQSGAYRRMQQSWGYGSVEVPYGRHEVHFD
jgi:lipopolysaccharide transport system ATP-binding protein